MKPVERPGAVLPPISPISAGAKPKKTRDQKEAEKALKQQAKRTLDARRPLTAWERYRALTDAFDEGLELVDLADHKARFAFVIMGALNVALVVLASRVEVLERVPLQLWPWLIVYMLAYALVAIYFFLQAIESLRPRSVRPVVPRGGVISDDDYPLGVRFFHDVLERDVVSHLQTWREIRVGQLNSEVARQAYALARINKTKYAALHRLYAGLKVMTLLAAGLIVLAILMLLRDTLAAPAAEGARTPSSETWSVLGEPIPVAVPGVREPSGVVYHKALGHLFVVGDEGRLVELDLTGEVVWSEPFRGNLEDVTVYSPTGDLVLLAEKKSELIFFDPVAHKERKRWQVDRKAVLGQGGIDKNQGFEGLTFRAEPSVAGGGIFYLVHQRAPALVVALAFDPSSPGARIDESAVKGRFKTGFKDLTAAVFVPALDRLLVLSDAAERLLVLTPEGRLEAEVVLPGRQQEGVTMDEAGDLWIADEKAGLLHFKGVEGAIRSHLGGARAR